jgi:hypothetical protein
MQTMRDFLHDVVAVRRGDHNAARLQLERERTAFLRGGDMAL